MTYHQQPREDLSSSSSGAAMSVFSKFSNMQSSIDQARRERSLIQDAISSTEQLIEECIATRNKELQSMQDHQHLLAQWTEKTHSTSTKLSEMSQIYSKEWAAREQVKLEHRLLEDWLLSSRENFLSNSREFRTACKRLRLQAALAGLEHASAAAFVASVQSPSRQLSHDNDVDIFAQLDRDDTLPPAPTRSDEDEGDPEAWSKEASLMDPTLGKLLSEYKTSRQEYELHHKKLTDRTQHKIKAQEEYNAVQLRKQQLQIQLEKIVADCEDLEKEVASLQEVINAHDNLSACINFNNAPQTVSNGSSLEPAALTCLSAHNGHNAAAAPQARNPYTQARKGLTVVESWNDINHVSTRPLTRKASPPEKMPTSKTVPLENQCQTTPLTTTKNQRRFRRDRQFGSSLQVQGAFSNEGNLVAALATPSVEIEDMSFRMDLDIPSSSTHDEPFLLDNYCGDNDDEDDDENLLFSPFSTKSKR